MRQGVDRIRPGSLMSATGGKGEARADEEPARGVTELARSVPGAGQD